MPPLTVAQPIGEDPSDDPSEKSSEVFIFERQDPSETTHRREPNGPIGGIPIGSIGENRWDPSDGTDLHILSAGCAIW